MIRKCNRKHGAAWIAAAVIATAVVFGSVSSSSAQNLLSNGDLESWSNGVPDSWRWYAVNGAEGSITQTTDPGTYSSGNSGALLTWSNNAGDSSLDRWDSKIAATGSHIYRYKVDAKYGSGQSAFRSNLLALSNGTPTREDIANWGGLLTSDFQTFSRELLLTPTENALSVRFDVQNSGAGASTYVDNVVLEDVTYANRMYNGDFENSSSQLLQWRFFNVGGNASASITHDAASGSNAALLSVADATGAADIGIDIWSDAICMIGGESLQISFDAKRLGTGNSVIDYQFLQFNSAGTPYLATNFVASPIEGEYSRFTQTVQVDANAAYGYIGFRIKDANGNLSTGNFLIDNVYMGAPVPEPGSIAGLGAGLMALIGFALKRRA